MVHGKAPAVAVEHGQRPQVDRVFGHVPLQHVADGVGGCAAVVVDHALGVAGGAAGVVEAMASHSSAGSSRQIAGRHRPRRFRSPCRGRCSGAPYRSSLHLHDEQHGVVRWRNQRRPWCRANWGPRSRPGFAVVQHEGDGFSGSSRVFRVEHRARHGHAESAPRPWAACWAA